MAFFNDFLNRIQHGAWNYANEVGNNPINLVNPTTFLSGVINTPDSKTNPLQPVTNDPLSDHSKAFAAGGISNPQSYGDGGSATAGTLGPNDGSGGQTYDVNPIKAHIQDYMSRLNALYDSLDGAVDRNVGDKQSQLADDYNTQVTDATKAFGASQNQLGNQFAARGLGDSSYLSSAQQDATNAFNTDLSNLTRSRDTNYAQLGQFAATQKAKLGSGRAGLSGINLGQYGNDASSFSALNSLDSSLQGQYNNLNETQAGLGTNADYQSQLNGITQAQQNTSAKLSQQLQTLLTSSASQFAKDQIAQGLIKSANLKDKNAEDYWQSYYSNLLRLQQPVAVA